MTSSGLIPKSDIFKHYEGGLEMRMRVRRGGFPVFFQVKLMFVSSLLYEKALGQSRFNSEIPFLSTTGLPGICHCNRGLEE